MIKYFRFDYDYVVWGISYVNLQMLQATIPLDDFEPDEKKEKVEQVDSLADLQDIFK